MAGVYRPRHPERTVLYWVLFHYFDRFLVEYESRFEKESGFLRPIVKEVARTLRGRFIISLSLRTACWPSSSSAKSLLLREELISEVLVEKIMGWRHSGFSVHSKVCYRYGEGKDEVERMDYLELIAFLTDYSAVDRIIHHLKLVFVASKPPPPQIAYQEVLMAAETSAEYFL